MIDLLLCLGGVKWFEALQRYDLMLAQISISIQVKHLLELIRVHKPIAVSIRLLVSLRKRHLVGGIIQPAPCCVCGRVLGGDFLPE